MKHSNLFLALMLACSMIHPALAQTGDRLLDDIVRDRQAEDDRQRGNSWYRQTQYRNSKQAEQEELMKYLAVGGLDLVIGGITAAVLYKNEKNEKRKNLEPATEVKKDPEQ